LHSFIKNEATYAKWFPFRESGREKGRGSSRFTSACDCFLKGILLQQVQKFQKNRKINMQF